jgi:phosphatidylserine decarboxylase
LNRAPVRARVFAMRYHPGKFLNAIDPQSAILNENMVIGLEEEAPPHRKMVVRQIAGMYARRIVCAVRPGETLQRGDKVGMIKLGSRTELILPRESGLQIAVCVGDRVQAGSSVLAQYPTSDGAKP